MTELDTPEWLDEAAWAAVQAYDAGMFGKPVPHSAAVSWDAMDPDVKEIARDQVMAVLRIARKRGADI